MRALSMAAASFAIFIPVLSAPALAAPGSIAGTVKVISPLITTLKLPVVGRLGNVSLGSAVDDLPGLAKIKLPVIGSLDNVPLVSTITVSQGLQLVESIAPLKSTLPGIGALNSALEPVVVKLLPITAKLP